MHASRPLLALAALFLGSIARAQTGTLDQFNPPHPPAPAYFVWMSGAGVWQQHVRAGRAGRLEGFQLQLYGIPGATITVRIRLGAGCNPPQVFQGTMTMTVSNWEDIYIDVTSAQINVVPGTEFVIETDGGVNPNLSIIGNQVDPVSGPPLYPEALYAVGPMCYLDCCTRMGFTTWVLESATTYCAGDGSGSACPCGNAGAAEHGCASSVSTVGASLSATGSASVMSDTLVLAGNNMPQSFALYFQGTTRTLAGAGAAFGDGLRCASGVITRIGVKANTNGHSAYPRPGDAPISIQGAISAGSVRQYQCWYRNAAPYCTPYTFNLTNGLEVTWAP